MKVTAKTLFYSLAAACLMLMIPLKASAQQMDESRRDKIFNELRSYKHDVIAKELSLSKEQQKEFFAVYDEMDDKLMQISAETRDLERKVSDDKNASDTEIEAAAAAVYSQKEREAKIEMEYYDRFKEILSPRQLLRLKGAEKTFTQQLVKHHRRLRNK